MIAETERQESDNSAFKIKPPSKLHLLKWILKAQEMIESKGTILTKSFLVTGITKEKELIRDEPVFQEIQAIMRDVFGDAHLGYVEPEDSPSGDESDDPFVL